MSKYVRASVDDLPDIPPWIVLEVNVAGSPHAHQAFVDRTEGWEACMDLLYEAMLKCNEDRHDGHGRTHSHGDIIEAMKGATNQLDPHEQLLMWQELKQKIRRWQRWGGPVPEAVFMPDLHDPKQWQAVLVDPDGTPRMAKVRDGIFNDMPTPTDKTAVRTPYGWQRKRQVGMQAKLKRVPRK